MWTIIIYGHRETRTIRRRAHDLTTKLIRGARDVSPVRDYDNNNYNAIIGPGIL